jgi:hypothetical protein
MNINTHTHTHTRHPKIQFSKLSREKDIKTNEQLRMEFI